MVLLEALRRFIGKPSLDLALLKNSLSLQMFRITIKAVFFLITGIGLTVGALPSPTFAQANLRSTFPGRRVGGGIGQLVDQPHQLDARRAVLPAVPVGSFSCTSPDP